MSRLHAKPWKIRRLAGADRFVAFVVAIGLLLQSYVVQTHIHFGPQEFGGVLQASGHVPGPEQGPLDKAARCPLCQAIVQAGAFVAPSAPLIYLPFGWVRTARLVFVTPAASGGVAHDWRSRAPPRG